MKKILTAGALLFVLMTNLAVECDGTPPLGSSNYRSTDTSNNGIDTTKIKRLTQPVSVNLVVKVDEYDTVNRIFLVITDAAVHVSNNDTTIYSDSTGYARTKFNVDSLPYKYEYVVSKSGFVSTSITKWDTSSSISHGITLVRE